MSETISWLEMYVKGSVKSAIASAFEELLKKEINIPEGIRSSASDSHNHLRDFLSGVAENDDYFPRVLAINDRDFLGGSYARHTKIWPLDDIDIYIPLDGYKLIYTQDGMPLPYTTITDNVLQSNPLSSQRWMDNNNISSKKLIGEFATVLKGHYSQSEVKPDGQAINIRMTLGATNSECTVLDCFVPGKIQQWRDEKNNIVRFYPFLVILKRHGKKNAIWLPYWHIVTKEKKVIRKYGQWAPFMDSYLFQDLLQQAQKRGLYEILTISDK